MTEECLQILVDDNPRLRRIHLHKCKGLTDAVVHSVAVHCHLLQEFCISECVSVSDDSMCELVRSCLHLHTLEIELCHLLTDLLVDVETVCHRMRKVAVFSCSLISDERVQGLRAINRWLHVQCDADNPDF